METTIWRDKEEERKQELVQFTIEFPTEGALELHLSNIGQGFKDEEVNTYGYASLVSPMEQDGKILTFRTEKNNVFKVSSDLNEIFKETSGVNITKTPVEQISRA